MQYIKKNNSFPSFNYIRNFVLLFCHVIFPNENYEYHYYIFFLLYIYKYEYISRLFNPQIIIINCSHTHLLPTI